MPKLTRREKDDNGLRGVLAGNPRKCSPKPNVWASTWFKPAASSEWQCPANFSDASRPSRSPAQPGSRPDDCASGPGRVCRQKGEVPPGAETAEIEGWEPFAWRHNALRHSFVSYRLATIQNTAQVALEAGNRPQMIFHHYEVFDSVVEAFVKGGGAGAWLVEGLIMRVLIQGEMMTSRL